MFGIEESRALPEGLDRLIVVSVAEGFHMLERLAQRWRSGESRFDGPGEGLFAARQGGCLVGTAGVCRDPYLDDPRVGRVRHVYVHPAARRAGVGGALVHAAVARGTTRFRRLRLRSDTVEGDRFYRALGFGPSREDGATHVLEGVSP